MDPEVCVAKIIDILSIQKQPIETLQAGNVVALRHILFHGEYDLTKEMPSDEFELIDPKL